MIFDVWMIFDVEWGGILSCSLFSRQKKEHFSNLEKFDKNDILRTKISIIPTARCPQIQRPNTTDPTTSFPNPKKSSLVLFRHRGFLLNNARTNTAAKHTHTYNYRSVIARTFSSSHFSSRFCTKHLDRDRQEAEKQVEKRIRSDEKE